MSKKYFNDPDFHNQGRPQGFDAPSEAQDLNPEPIDTGAVYNAAVSGRWKWWLTLLVFAVLLLVVVLFTTGAKTVEKPEPATADVVKTEDVVVAATLIEENIKYNACGHSKTELLQGNAMLGKSFAELSTEGWEVTKIGSDKIRINKEVDGLCDEDKEKRTIKTTPNGIGVYTGGVGTDGDIITEIPLNIKDLPSDMQNQLADGGIEFASENELLEMMDSLDEYVGYGEPQGNI